MGITTFLAKSLINYQSEDSFAFKLRKKRFERLKQLIDQYYQKNKRVNIIAFHFCCFLKDPKSDQCQTS